MTAIRIAFVLFALGVPSLLAPPLVRFRPWIPAPLGRFLVVIVCLVPLSAPFGLGPTARPGRTVLIAILGGIVMLKTIDWLSSPRHDDEPLRVWLALSFWPALEIEDVGVRIIGIPGRIALAVRRLAAGSAGVAVGLLLATMGQSLDLPARSIWLDGSLKALEIYALAGGANSLMVGAFGFAGYRLTDAFRYPIFARSVLDFWSRYNVWIYRWLKRHVFEPIGWRRRRPALGILAVFAVSGLLHEFLFVVAVPEMIGWQFAFFGLHGLGALAGAWLGRGCRAIAGRRAPRALAIAATLGFLLLTAPIFIRCMDRVLDLHRDVGSWVLGPTGTRLRPSQAGSLRRSARARLGLHFQGTGLRVFPVDVETMLQVCFVGFRK